MSLCGLRDRNRAMVSLWLYSTRAMHRRLPITLGVSWASKAMITPGGTYGSTKTLGLRLLLRSRCPHMAQRFIACLRGQALLEEDRTAKAKRKPANETTAPGVSPHSFKAST